jgi:O-antigen/teichoic acid export membrane protein
LSLSVVGAASICDLGIGRALSKYVAEEGDARCFGGANRSFHSALTMTLSLSILFTTAFILAVPFLVTRVFHVRAENASDATLVFLFTALALPAVLVRILLDGLLVGKQRIAPLTIVNTLAATMKIGAGFTMALCHSPVHALVLGYCFISYIHVVALGWLCFRGPSPIATIGMAWDSHVIKQLLRLGSLSTAANGTSYIFLCLDRWIIAAFLPMSVLGYYTVAFDIACRQWVVGNAITQAFFPVFSHSAQVSREALTASYLQASKMMFVATTGTSVILACFARPLLSFWIGGAMGADAGTLLEILAIGIVFACYFNLPFNVLLAGSARPEIIAVQLALAAVIHLAISTGSIRWLGPVGVALGFATGYLAALLGSHIWLARHAFSANALRHLVQCLLPCWGVASGIAIPIHYALSGTISNLAGLLAVMGLAYAMYVALATWLCYSPAERSLMRRRAISLIPAGLAGGRA